MPVSLHQAGKALQVNSVQCLRQSSPACRAGHELVSFDPGVRIGQQRIKGLREDPDRIATVNFDRRAATVHEKPWRHRLPAALALAS